jgi:hypothetical protein
MLSALDFICIQVQARVGGKRIRRNKQIVEILDIDPRTNELITNEVFGWRSATDEINYSGKSYLLKGSWRQRDGPRRGCGRSSNAGRKSSNGCG